MVVFEKEIPEDWPAGQTDHTIFTFEAYSDDEGALTFALVESDDSAKFSLIPAGVNDAGNYIAHLYLKEGEELDYETQDTFLIGVEVSTISGATTQMLLRLKITEVVEGSPSPSPSPTPSASPTPVATPTDPCFEEISGEVNIVRTWDSSCLSVNRPDDQGAGDYYARFFTFTLDDAATVTISLKSEIDTYLYLMHGTGKGGEVETENDDVVQFVDFNSGIEDYSLSAGDYTIEATAFEAEKSGSFRLVVTGLPDDGQSQADCSTGAAVSNATENTDLVQDCETLLALRDALVGTALLNWDANLRIEDWSGITVGGSPQRVTEIALDDSGLNGNLPMELGTLSGLQVLSLSGNRLKGTIPDELGNLSNLTELSIDNNELNGSIPEELGDLSKLETLALNDNRLSGAIPSELGRLASLTSLVLANNNLDGPVPVELGELTNLEELKLSGNQLTGCIPPTLQSVTDNDLSESGLLFCVSGKCSTGAAVENPDDNAGLVADCNTLLSMESVLAGRVRLNWSADVPIEHWEGVKVGGSPKRVIHLVLIQRGLSGRLPTELGRLSNLSLLQLSSNELRGGIPAELGSLGRLELLILADNELSGEIPPELDGLASLSHLSLTGNQLSGTIPPELSSLTKLSSLYLNDNDLRGSIPEELGSLSNLRFLYLDDNDLSGAIPSKLGDSRTLEELSIDGNRLNGPIPPELGAISSLELLSLESNMLSGAIPPELGSLTKLEVLSLAANRLVGEIPAQLGAIPNLRTLSLHSNEFTGCIPKELADVPRNDLISLGLEFCGEGRCAGGTAVTNPNDNHGLVSDCNALLAALDKLRGSATLNWSTELAIDNWEGVVTSGTPKRITELNLSAKQLNGVVPSELGNLTYLGVLNLSDNALTGEIPSEFARLSNLEGLLLANNRLSGQIPHDLTRIGNLSELRVSGNLFTGCIPDGLEDVEDNDLDTLENLPLCGEVDCSSGSAVEQPGDNEDLVSDCETLFELRDQLAGMAYLNWSVHRAIDNWDGITVGGSPKRVTKIELNDMGLSGIVPAGLGDLEGLEVLALSGNELRGQIPSELGKLTNLKRLLLDGNQLSGEISPELAVLNNLVEARLSGNNLSRCIPEQWRGVATNDFDEVGLAFCIVGECSTGTAVDSPDANPGLVADCDVLLTVRDTLRGIGILNWSSVVSIEEWNGVTIEGSPKRVTQLKIGQFRLDGEIAPELGLLSKLKELSLADNRLSGEIPSELGNLAALERLTLSDNQLTGKIPTVLGDLTALEHLSLSDNRLNGEIPSELGGLSNLNHLSLYNNSLTEGIPSELGNLTALQYLRLSDNRLTGNIPTELSNLSDLRHLHLSRNQLHGTIPSELGGLANLRILHLADNGLTGDIPSELGSLSKLTELYLSRNQLTGAIPSELGSLSKLTELYLSGNQLTGAIPAELGDLSDLVQLYLPGNKLTGDIPVELANLDNLMHLFLSGNEFGGCIPEGLKDVSRNDLDQLNLPDC